jgi:hypothetical protein
MQYPGRNIKAGESDGNIVKALKRQLNKALGIDDNPAKRLDPNNPNFGPKMKQMVKLFQARNVDDKGLPLKQDGIVGALTWAALFGSETVPITNTSSDQFLAKVLEIAAGEEAKRVREVPKNSNRGPEVDIYLRRAGISPPDFWCCAFVYWCFDEAARAIGRTNPMVKTAHCMTHWRSAGARGAQLIGKWKAIDNPGLVKPGMILIIDHGGDRGHTGLVEKVDGAWLTTIEGNTDGSGTREGGGVYRLIRKTVEINKGFIDYSGL